MGWSWVLALTAAGLVASTANAAFGIGGGLLVMPLLTLGFGPRMVIPYTVPMFIASNVMVAWRYRGQTDRRYLIWLVPGVVVGIVVGTWFLRLAPSQIVREIMGGVAVVFVAVEALRLLVRRPLPVLPLVAGVPLSVASGLASALTNLGGTVISLVLLGRGLVPAAFVATLNMIMVVMSAAKMVAFGGVGLIGLRGFLLAMPSVPAVLLGSYWGRAINQRLDPTWFRWVMLLLIGTSAVLLVVGY